MIIPGNGWSGFSFHSCTAQEDFLTTAANSAQKCVGMTLSALAESHEQPLQDVASSPDQTS